MKRLLSILSIPAILLALSACNAQQSAPDQAAIDDSVAPIGLLGDLSEPLYYEVDLTVDPREDEFYGTVALSFRLNRAAEHFWLHGNNLQVERVELLANNQRYAASYEQVLSSGVAKIAFPMTLDAGDYEVVIHYRAAFDLNLSGLFKVEEQGLSYALAKSESVQARKFLPGFDEPGQKAPFEFTLTVPAAMHAISNTPEASVTELDNGMKRVTYLPTPAMPTYLLSLAVGPFDRVEGPTIPANEFRENEVPLVGYSRAGRGAELDYILSITPEFLEIFERELESPYPFRKLDIIAAPAWPSGATELSAAITYRESRILLGPNPAPQARLGLLSIHAHELAHMWFGNLVTPTWWDDLWLKEGFSSWMEPVAMAEFEPKAGHEIGTTVDGLRAMSLDSLASTRAIREPIDRNEDIRNAYDAITYAKSTGVIHMMDSYFGPELFRPALGRYVARFAEGRADAAEFYDEIATQSGEPRLVESFRSFVEQPGLPQINTEVSCANNHVTVAVQQQRYAPPGSTIDTQAQQWDIPMCFVDANGHQQCDILTQKTASWEWEGACPAWVFPNANGAGYYRFNTDAANWQALIANFSDFSAPEAMVLIDSAFAAFAQGTLPAEELKLLVEASTESTNRHVVAAAMGRIRGLLAVSDEASKAPLAAWANGLYSPLLETWSQGSDEDSVILTNQLRSSLAQSFDNQMLRAELAQQAAAFTGYNANSADSSALTTDEYQMALTVAVEDLGDNFSHHLLAFADSFDDSRFRAAAVNALSASTSADFVATQHAFVLADATESRESWSMIAGAMTVPELRSQHWSFVQANFEAISKKIPAQWRRRMPLVGTDFCSASEQGELQALFAEFGELTPGFERALAQTSERISLCEAAKPSANEFANQLIK
ncbi:MAG: M1 family metallopeptidase [Pseudomonadales bacterium]|jgi:alanyl aminopeptidase